MMHITESQKHEIAELAKKYGLFLVVLFGSQATGKTHTGSDVDIGVIAGNDFDYKQAHALEEKLASLFKRLDIEVVNLRQVSPLLLKRVAGNGKLLYENRPGQFIRLKVRAVRAYADTAPLRSLEGPRIELFLQKHGG